MGPARRHLPIDGSLGMRNLLWDVVDGIMLNCAAALYVYNKKVLQLLSEEVAKMNLNNYGAYSLWHVVSMVTRSCEDVV